jgi:hypothetical protein
MVLTLRPLPVQSLATCHTPTSTAHLLSRSTYLTAVILATLLAAHPTATIAETTAPTLVVEGKDLAPHGILSNEADAMFRHYDDRDYDSEEGSKYRRRSRYD